MASPYSRCLHDPGGNLIVGETEHHALGVSRGGWGTKIHAACDQNRQMLSFLITAGQAGDPNHMIGVLD